MARISPKLLLLAKLLEFYKYVEVNNDIFKLDLLAYELQDKVKRLLYGLSYR